MHRPRAVSRKPPGFAQAPGACSNFVVGDAAAALTFTGAFAVGLTWIGVSRAVVHLGRRKGQVPPKNWCSYKQINDIRPGCMTLVGQMARQLSGRAPPDHGVAMRPVMNLTYSVALYRPWKRARTAPSLRQPTCSLWPPWLRTASARLKAASRAGREPRLGRADAVGPRLAGTAVACRRCTPRHGERSRHRKASARR